MDVAVTNITLSGRFAHIANIESVALHCERDHVKFISFFRGIAVYALFGHHFGLHSACLRRTLAEINRLQLCPD